MSRVQLRFAFDAPDVTVHCFTCPHVVRGTPLWAHAAMEAHYAEKHEALISRLAGAGA